MNSCCQPYTIRLDTREYTISQSQKKVMKKFNKFLAGEIDINGNKIEEEKDTQPIKVEETQQQEDVRKQKENI